VSNQEEREKKKRRERERERETGEMGDFYHFLLMGDRYFQWNPHRALDY